MKRTTIWLSSEQSVRLKALAEQRGIAFSDLVRRALDGYEAVEQDSDEIKTMLREILGLLRGESRSS